MMCGWLTWMITLERATLGLDELFPEERDKLAIQEVECGNIQLTDYIMDQILY